VTQFRGLQVKKFTDCPNAVTDAGRKGRTDAPMELLIALGAFIALGMLAMRFGQDTRDGIVSEEERLSRYGFTWAPMTEPRQVTSRVSSISTRALEVAQSCTRAISSRSQSLGRNLANQVDATDGAWPALQDYPYRITRK
jgi:hypothetical protein